MFDYRNKSTLVSYNPKKGKVVLLLSSLHVTDSIDKNNREKRKTEIVTSYNQTKGGVDMVDKLCALYNCVRNPRRWSWVVDWHKFSLYMKEALTKIN
jgi:hypothetical protein